MKIPIYVIFVACMLGSCNTNSNKVAAAKNIDTVKNNISKNSIMLHIKAKPDSVSIDAANTAVIIIDMQNEYGSKGGMFDRAGFDISGIQKAEKPIADVLAVARQKNIQVIYVNTALDSFPFKDTSIYRIGDTMTAPDGSINHVLIRNYWGTKVVPALNPFKQDIEVYKTRWSGFYQTTLDSVLKKLNVQFLVFTGCTTSVCIESTIFDATFRDYSPILLSDCTAEPLSQKNYEASLKLVENRFGWVSNSTEFIKALDIYAQP